MPLAGAPIGYSPAMTNTAATEETMAFGELEIAFDERVLRPRPWTADQSAWAVELLRTAPDGPLLELCSGAGQIGLLAAARSRRPLVCVDVNPVACAYNRRNAENAGLADLVEVREGLLEESLRPDERFAVVIADPPWVRRTETDAFPEDPLVAIDGGDDGLDVAWACLRVAARHLSPGGSAVLQLGTVDQAAHVRDRLTSLPGLRAVEVRQGERGVLLRVDRIGDASGA
ncbi:MAG: methyltransferase small [Nocardioides sp.]|nr:methyltransferase small [Nocardioides sp.]